RALEEVHTLLFDNRNRLLSNVKVSVPQVRQVPGCPGFQGAGFNGFSVRIEALSRLATEMSRGDHALEQRTGAVLRIAEAVVHDVENGDADVQADEVGERQRAHRVVHAQLHDGVD